MKLALPSFASFEMDLFVNECQSFLLLKNLIISSKIMRLLDLCTYTDRNWNYNDTIDNGICYSNLSLSPEPYSLAESNCFKELESSLVLTRTLDSLTTIFKSLQIELRVELIWLGLRFNQGILCLKWATLH